MINKNYESNITKEFGFYFVTIIDYILLKNKL